MEGCNYIHQEAYDEEIFTFLKEYKNKKITSIIRLAITSSYPKILDWSIRNFPVSIMNENGYIKIEYKYNGTTRYESFLHRNISGSIRYILRQHKIMLNNR